MRSACRALFVIALVACPAVAGATPITKVEPNDSPATAQNLNPFFSIDFSVDIEDASLANTSTTIPHVTVNAFGADAGNGTIDWYSFTTSGGLAIFDIDYGAINADNNSDFDPWIRLLNSSLAIVLQNDDGQLADSGSFSGLDSFMQTTLVAGTYYIGVGSYCCFAEIPSGGDYALQVSVENVAPVPEPGSWLLFGTGLAITCYRKYRRAK